MQFKIFLDFQGLKAIFSFLIFAVICTFSFGSAFAALPYAAKTTVDLPVAAQNDFYGYSSDNAVAMYYGTFGISTIQQESEAIGLENAKIASSTSYPADLQAKVDAAFDTAIAAVKAAKTNKEMMLAEEDLADQLALLAPDKNTRAKVRASYTDPFTVGTQNATTPA